MSLSTIPMTRARPSTIWIADPQPADYAGLSAADEAGRLEVRFLASARDVLRQWMVAKPDVCIFNVQLPDLNGFDLAEMLRPFPAGVTVFMVDDRYGLEHEVRALSLGIHHYLCKPLDAAVLTACCACRKPERRCCH